MHVGPPTMDRVNPSIWWVLPWVAWGQKIAELCQPICPIRNLEMDEGKKREKKLKARSIFNSLLI